MKDIFDSYSGKAYRFITFDGFFNTISSKHLRFSRVDQFNDPLDNSPYLLKLNWEELSEKGDEYVRAVSRIAFEKAFSSMYICSFSKTYSSEKSYLMWSHYGQSHSQLCFEIDFSTINYFGKPTNVTYPLDLLELRESKFKDGGEKGVFITTYKDKIWSYEEEVRLVFDIRNGNIDFEKIKIVDNGKKVDITFNLSYISKIIFGYNSMEYEELRTIQMFEKIGHQPLYEKMTIDPMTLKLKPIKYEPRE